MILQPILGGRKLRRQIRLVLGRPSDVRHAHSYMTFSRDHYASCCAKTRAYYVFDEAGFREINNRLTFMEEIKVNAGFYFKRGTCEVCGMVWRYERECVGHMDWETRLFKETWAISSSRLE